MKVANNWLDSIAKSTQSQKPNAGNRCESSTDRMWWRSFRLICSISICHWWHWCSSVWQFLFSISSFFFRPVLYRRRGNNGCSQCYKFSELFFCETRELLIETSVHRNFSVHFSYVIFRAMNLLCNRYHLKRMREKIQNSEKTKKKNKTRNVSVNEKLHFLCCDDKTNKILICKRFWMHCVRGSTENIFVVAKA